MVSIGGEKYNRFYYTDPASKDEIPVSIPVKMNAFRSPGTPNLLIQEHESVPAAGKDCKEVNLAEKFGAARNQGALPWCYAESAGDYLSFRAGKRLSVTDLAIRTHVALKK